MNIGYIEIKVLLEDKDLKLDRKIREKEILKELEKYPEYQELIKLGYKFHFSKLGNYEISFFFVKEDNDE
jgi:hypothetical protein